MSLSAVTAQHRDRDQRELVIDYQIRTASGVPAHWWWLMVVVSLAIAATVRRE